MAHKHDKEGEETLSGGDATFAGSDELEVLFLQSELDADDATSNVLEPVAPDETADGEEWFIYSLVLLRRGRWVPAIDALQATLSRDPGRKSKHAPRALACMGLALARDGRYEEATPWYQEALQLSPGAGEVWAALSVAQGKLGDREAAGVALEEGMRLKPDHPMMLFNLGNLRFGQGRIEECVEVLRRAHQLDATHVHTMVNLGAALAATDALAEAAEVLSEARRVDPANWRAALNHGVVLAQLWDFPASVEELRYASTLDPDAGRARILLARVMRCQGKGMDAVKELEIAKLNSGFEAAAWEMLGLIHSDHDNDDQALAAWKSGLKADPDYVRMHAHIGRHHLKAGRLDEAEAALSEAIRLRPERAETWMLEGELALSREQLDEAETKLAKAIDLDPELHGARYLLGRTLLHQGRMGEAVQHCEALSRSKSPLADRLQRKLARGEFPE